MSQFHSPDDRPDPAEQPIRARVPEHVSGGAFSTGVIVMTAQSEFILDFVQNLGRPHQIVARVIMPHQVLPQLVDALHRNIELYRQRWGELPNPMNVNSPPAPQGGERKQGPTPEGSSDPFSQKPFAPGTSSQIVGGGQSAPESTTGGQAGQQNPGLGSGTSNPGGAPSAGSGNASGPSAPAGQGGGSQLPPAGMGARQASAQEIYDELKIRDELLSGAYANAVMIGHGPHEFSFDFITNFYPHSAVSARVFLAAGQVPRLYDSLKGTWDQLRQRWTPPGGGFPPQSPPPDPGPIA